MRLFLFDWAGHRAPLRTESTGCVARQYLDGGANFSDCEEAEDTRGSRPEQRRLFEHASTKYWTATRRRL